MRDFYDEERVRVIPSQWREALAAGNNGGSKGRAFGVSYATDTFLSGLAYVLTPLIIAAQNRRLEKIL